MDDFDKLIDTICETYGITRDDIVSRSRGNRPAEHRLMAMWIARHHLELSWMTIARKFRRTHSTCIRNCYRFTQRLRQDKQLSERLDDLLKRLEWSN